MSKPWIKPTERMPEHSKLVFIALFEAQQESFQYYVGWYNSDEKEWFLTDYGYTCDVSFWMPIPELKED